MSEKQFCIVIPIYKETPDIIEEISLKRLHFIIGSKNYPVFFITHDELDISKYKDIFMPTDVILFDKYYFQNIVTYSHLCLSFDLYNTFREYEYLYIYQTDCYIVDDWLSKFCELGYDYIGAPIFSTDCGWPTNKIVDGVEVYEPIIGNGGFSLRKINTFLNLFEPSNAEGTILSQDYIRENIEYEDKFICVTLQEQFNLKIPRYDVGVAFCWDMNPDVITVLLGINKFPMCVHAWDKNIRFWNNYLPELMNNTEVLSFCEEKHYNLFTLYYNDQNETFR